MRGARDKRNSSWNIKNELKATITAVFTNLTKRPSYELAGCFQRRLWALFEANADFFKQI